VKKILELLGLANRAGKVRSGEEFSIKAVKAGDARLAFMDEGASALAKRTFEKAIEGSGVPLIYVPEGALGIAIGKPGRMAAVVTDEGFAKKMISIHGDKIPGRH